LEERSCLLDNPGMAAGTASQLVGRDVELERVRTVATFDEGPCSAVIRGAAGMGKTSIWREGTHAASAVGVRVLGARGVEAEMPLAFAVLADLLEDVVPTVAEALPVPQRLALEAALGGEAIAAGDPLLLPRAVLAALRLFAEAAPVLVAVDDAQWVDPASARVLAFVLRRLGDRHVATLATLRGGLEVHDPLRLADAYGPRLAQIELAPLSTGALQRLLRVRLGLRLPRPVLARVQEASGGNPMFALEFARTAAVSSGGDPLIVPATLEELVRDRVERLPSQLTPLLELAAVLERPTVSTLAPALGGVERTVALVEAAADADVLLIDDQDLVRFTHPLLATAIYARLTSPARRRLHRRSAALVDELEPRARHLALGCAEGGSAVVGLLEQAAAAAAHRGAPDAAAELVEHAWRLTPESEPTPRHQRALALARYLGESSQTPRAAVVLDELLAEDLTDPLRSEALVLRATVDDETARAAAFFSEALRYCGDNGSLRVRVLLCLAEAHAQWLGDLPGADAFIRQARACGEGIDDRGLQASILKWSGRIAALRGRPERELAWAAIELEGGAPPPLGQSGARCVLAQQLAWAGELATARALVEEHLSELADRGAEFDRAWQLPMLAEIELRQGEWELARRHAAEVEELFDPDDAWGQAMARAVQAALAVHTGDVDEGRRLALGVLAHAQQANLRLNALRYRWLLGFLELSRGDPAAAWQWLEQVPEELEEIGVREPGFVPVLPDAIETLVELAQPVEAERLLRRLDAQATALEHGWALAAAARSRALVNLAGNQSDAALGEAERAATQFEQLGYPLDQARALLVAGQALRRRGERRRAADVLGVAALIFERLSARLWLARAQQELGRATPRPRRNGELTAAERRVAGLVAAGKTNREVAAQLYVTIATVEAHLTRIYRKLDVRSRSELARRFGSELPESEPG
jgi:DNA-binding CsgD family transcriptional regulator